MFHELAGDHPLEGWQRQLVQRLRISAQHQADVRPMLELLDLLTGRINADQLARDLEEPGVEPRSVRELLRKVRMIDESEMQDPAAAALVQDELLAVHQPPRQTHEGNIRCFPSLERHGD
jgi:hypothetical protein